MNVKISIIADIHIGNSIPPSLMYKNLEEYYIRPTQKGGPDVIAICGDLTDRRLTLNSEAAIYLNKFIREIMRTNATIVYCHGTPGHEGGNVNFFDSEITEKFRIYRETTIDDICGIRTLIMPELHIPNPKDYYAPFFRENVEMVFGHGLFDYVSFLQSKSSSKRMTCPVFTAEDFSNVSGPVYFGHVHTRQIRDKRQYVGSFGRYNHAEEEDKGFLQLVYDTNSNKVISEEFIVNKGALRFDTVLESSLPRDRDATIATLTDLVNKTYRLRIRLDKKIDDQRMSDIISFAKTNYSVTVDKHYTKKNKIETEEVELISNKYENMSAVDAISEYVVEHHNIHLDKEYIASNIRSPD